MLLGTGSETFYLLPHYHRIHHDSAQKCRSTTMRSPSHHHAETLPNTEVRLQGDEVPVVEGGGGVLGDGLVLLDKGEEVNQFRWRQFHLAPAW